MYLKNNNTFNKLLPIKYKIWISFIKILIENQQLIFVIKKNTKKNIFFANYALISTE